MERSNSEWISLGLATAAIATDFHSTYPVLEAFGPMAQYVEAHPLTSAFIKGFGNLDGLVLSSGIGALGIIAASAFAEWKSERRDGDYQFKRRWGYLMMSGVSALAAYSNTYITAHM